MWNKVSKVILTAAVTIPLTVQYVRAQDSMEDIYSYSQSIQARLAHAEGPGRFSNTEFNDIQNTFNNVQGVIRSYGNRRINETDRAEIMRSLLKLDQQVTDRIHDNENSRYQYWDGGHNSWNQKWWQAGWKNPTPVSNWDRDNHDNHGDRQGNYWRENKAFIADISARKDRIQQRMEQGRNSGRLSGRELQDLTAQYNRIEDLQRRMMSEGLNESERNALTQQLDELDRNITAQMHDDDRNNGRGRHNGHGWAWGRGNN